MRKYFCCLFVSILSISAFSGEQLKFNNFDKAVVPFVALQIWNTVSFDNQLSGEAVDSRYGMYFRRARPGFKGHPLDRLYYNVQLSADFLGKDQFLSSKGPSNTGAIKVWSAYITYRLSKQSQWFNLTTGYMLPHISRESTTTPWTMSSLDKAETSCYLRQFATGKSNGISSGINLGGTGVLSEYMSASYNFAFLSNMHGGVTQGREYAPLLIGHLILTIGATERNAYKFTADDNVLSDNIFVSFGVGASFQDQCDYFQKNTTFSTDLKLNFKGFHLLTEYSEMKRDAGVNFKAHNFLIRSGYNIDWKYSGILEPVFSYRGFYGEDNGEEVGFYTGKDTQVDVGINWWLSGQKMKINVHYLVNSGNGNNFSSKESDHTKRGNIAVLGLQVVL
ncbi:porin family protein [Marinilabilia rubra]|uniref:Porin n=1 Tax=Marinilabilia rubra TaxID=2162893 RepID=A0A2U2BD24_9BACT|nr:hypothetical protein [Marinilabilia rubra]PWE00960.1 hypothetical protein DDZ16_00260 [Marinilabilia rubra]